MFRDILLPIGGFPDPLPESGLKEAMALAKGLGAQVTALAFEIDFHLPSNVLANALLDLPGMVATARQRAHAQTARALATIGEAGSRYGVTSEHVSVRCLEAEIVDEVTRRARLRDMTMVVAPEAGSMQQWLAESVIFGAGRPVVIMPGREGRSLEGRPLTVALAWDGSRPAARALADALPILKTASAVTVVTVKGEKALPKGDVFDDLKRHLNLHGIAAECVDVPAGGRAIGSVLGDFARDRSVDLLVMGAYAHSRMRDFVLGGATMSMVAAPPVPVFLSH